MINSLSADHAYLKTLYWVGKGKEKDCELKKNYLTCKWPSSGDTDLVYDWSPCGTVSFRLGIITLYRHGTLIIGAGPGLGAVGLVGNIVVVPNFSHGLWNHRDRMKNN